MRPSLREGTRKPSKEDKAKEMSGSGSSLPPCVVRSVTLAGFPEVVTPKSVNRKRGEMNGDSFGAGSWSRLQRALVAQ